jgi:ABC-type polar amino acid transport system ATPase subunit
MTMLVITHEMAFAKDVSDRAVFMDDGNIVEQSAPSELFSNPRHPRTRQFLQRMLPGIPGGNLEAGAYGA